VIGVEDLTGGFFFFMLPTAMDTSADWRIGAQPEDAAFARGIINQTTVRTVVTQWTTMPTYEVIVTETCERRLTVVARDRRQAARNWRRQVDLSSVDAECSEHVDVDLDDPICDTGDDDDAL